jgi:hypothetical protein
MFSSAACQAIAEEKLAQAAKVDPRFRRRFLVAAEAWQHLAAQIRVAEPPFTTGEIVAKVRRSAMRK